MNNYTITPVTVYRVEGGFRRRDVSSMKLAEELRDGWSGIDCANDILDAGGQLRDAMDAMNRPCPPEIAHLTKDYGIQISHWQCTDYYAYTIQYITETGELRVGGIGGLSGYYGNTMSVEELVSYPNRLGVESDPRAGVK